MCCLKRSLKAIGARGRTISLACTADKVGLPKNGERFKWVQSYSSAKSRQRAAAGYPKDTGGLLAGEPDVGR